MDDWFIAPALALVAGLLALAPLGARVLARGVVFIDLAVAQAAAAAALVALVVGDHPPGLVVQAAALGGSLAAAAAVAMVARLWPAQREALIGLIYVACACAALLAAQRDAHGAEHLNHLLAADVLWASWPDVLTLAAGAMLVTLIRPKLHRDVWFYGLFAVAASLAVQVLGLFVVFAGLIAPGLWHRRGLPLSAATLLALAAAFVALGLSWWLDLPSGPLVALSLALCGLACLALPVAVATVAHSRATR